MKSNARPHLILSDSRTLAYHEAEGNKTYNLASSKKLVAFKSWLTASPEFVSKIYDNGDSGDGAKLG